MKIPPLHSLDLAYETGVHLGDGCFQYYRPYDYRYAISGKRQNEQEYYRAILSTLLHQLYDLNPGIYESHNSIYLYLYSKELVQFKHEAMGMPIGRKSQLSHLPDYVSALEDKWVGKFLAGFYDTDGSVKLRRTPVKNYPRISIAQKMGGIISDVKQLLWNRFSISSTMYENSYLDPRTGSREDRWFLDINGYENFDRFMLGIGTRSPYVLGRIALLGLKSINWGWVRIPPGPLLSRSLGNCQVGKGQPLRILPATAS